MQRGYVPEAGDIVWLNFTPQTEREQAGHRPELVLSPRAYNEKTSLMVCCPMTTQIKNYPSKCRLRVRRPQVSFSPIRSRVSIGVFGRLRVRAWPRRLVGRIAHVTTQKRPHTRLLGRVCRVGRQQFRKEPRRGCKRGSRCLTCKVALVKNLRRNRKLAALIQ